MKLIENPLVNNWGWSAVNIKVKTKGNNWDWLWISWWWLQKRMHSPSKNINQKIRRSRGSLVKYILERKSHCFAKAHNYRGYGCQYIICKGTYSTWNSDSAKGKVLTFENSFSVVHSMRYSRSPVFSYY